MANRNRARTSQQTGEKEEKKTKCFRAAHPLLQTFSSAAISRKPGEKRKRIPIVMLRRKDRPDEGRKRGGGKKRGPSLIVIRYYFAAPVVLSRFPEGGEGGEKKKGREENNAFAHCSSRTARKRKKGEKGFPDEVTRLADIISSAAEKKKREEWSG